MPYIRTERPKDATGDVRDMYQRQQDHWGYVPNYAKVFSRRPEVLARWGRLLAEIRRPMGDRLFELVTFAASLELKNTACAIVHGRALTAYFPADDLVAVREGRYSDAFSAADVAIIEFTRKVARDAAGITEGDVAVLKKHGCSDDDIFDIVATAAGRAFFTKLLDALGVEGDSPLLEIDPAFREPLTLGRPLSFRPVETLQYDIDSDAA